MISETIKQLNQLIVNSSATKEEKATMQQDLAKMILVLIKRDQYE